MFVESEESRFWQDVGDLDGYCSYGIVKKNKRKLLMLPTVTTYASSSSINWFHSK